MTCLTEPQELRFSAATYNIHRSIGPDGKQDPERIAEVIQQLDANIIGLQEVESLYEGEPGLHQLNYLAGRSGLRAVAGPAVFYADSHYGNALLTSAPVINVRRHDLSVAGREPRGALDVDLKIHDRDVRVIVTHLGLHAGERRRQTQDLLKILSQPSRQLTILLGDFNEWLPWSRPIRWLSRRLGKSPAYGTFPARYPLFALDRIWISHGHPQTRADFEVLKTNETVNASDHLPLKTTVKLSAQG